MREVARLEVDEHEAAHEVVVEDEVDEEVAPVHGDTLLTRLKREAAPKLQQKALQVRDERGLDVRLAELLVLGDAEELEHVRVSDDVLGTPWRLLLKDLRSNGLLVAAREQALTEHGVDLPLELTRAPAALGALVHVPHARLGVRDARKAPVVRPAQFGTQCVPNWERKVELAHEPEVALVKPLPKVLREPPGKLPRVRSPPRIVQHAGDVLIETLRHDLSRHQTVLLARAHVPSNR